LDKLHDFLNSYKFLISYKDDIEENYKNLNRNLLFILIEIFKNQEKINIHCDFLNILFDFIIFLFKNNQKDYIFSISLIKILGYLFSYINKNYDFSISDEKTTKIYERIFNEFIGSIYLNEIFYFENYDNDNYDKDNIGFNIDFYYTFYLLDFIINILKYSNGRRISFIINNSIILIPYLIEIFDEIEKIDNNLNIKDYSRNILLEKVLISFNIIIIHDKKLIYNLFNIDKRLINLTKSIDFNSDKDISLIKKILYILNNLSILANDNHMDLNKLINSGILNFLKEILIYYNDKNEINICLNLIFFYLFSFEEHNHYQNSKENKIIDLFNMEIGIEVLEKFIFSEDKKIKQKTCIIFNEFYLTENNIKKLRNYNFTYDNLTNIYNIIQEEKKFIENQFDIFMDIDLILSNSFINEIN
jgi:hypothetical protein